MYFERERRVRERFGLHLAFASQQETCLREFLPGVAR